MYTPPACSELPNLISIWEKYVNSRGEPDICVQTAIAHYQFEAIHPFLDGNGRIGRLLIPIILYERGLHSYPLLYVSEYFERNREEYYSFLRLVDTENDWDSWIKYFLASLKVQALDTMKRVLKMLELYQSIKDKLSVYNSQYAINLLDIIFENPIIKIENTR